MANNFIPLQAVDELLDISSIPSYAWIRNPSARNPPLSSTHLQVSSFCLIEHWSAEEIAKAMSNIEHKVLSRISTGELKQYIKIGKISSETQLERFSGLLLLLMGVHLKDLIAFWHSANLEQFEETRKISERSYLLSNFLSVNRTPPNFGNANSDLVNALKKVLFDTIYNEHELYNLSLKREPKAHDNELFLNNNQNNITSHSAIDIRIEETTNTKEPLKETKIISKIPLPSPKFLVENSKNNNFKQKQQQPFIDLDDFEQFISEFNLKKCHRQQRPPLQHQQHLKEENETKQKESTTNNSNKKSITANYMTGWMNALLSPRFETLGPSSFFGTTRTGNYTQRSGGRYRTSSSSDAPSREALKQNISSRNEKTIHEQGHNGKKLKNICKLMGSNKTPTTSGTAKEKCRQQRSAEIICENSPKQEIKKDDRSSSAQNTSRATSFDQKTMLFRNQTNNCSYSSTVDKTNSDSTENASSSTTLTPVQLLALAIRKRRGLMDQ
uniref:PiggyBac transposable element-derived protein domain-containing protein n=1 Tax=Meloidogyne javanica TaxID=6303 RepID=A0A915MC73_MELJA